MYINNKIYIYIYFFFIFINLNKILNILHCELLSDIFKRFSLKSNLYKRSNIFSNSFVLELFILNYYLLIYT